MAVDEACTNVIEHAYDGEDAGDIQITCTVQPGSCEIEVYDQGKPFVPEEVPQPKTQTSIEDLKPGGIGLHIMRQVMDEIDFTFDDNGNRLSMVKRGAVPATMVADDNIPTYASENGVWIVAPEGRMDSAAAPQMESALMVLIEAGRRWLIVDLSGVTYISSRGLKSLVKAWRAVQAENGALVLTGLTPQVYEVFDTVGFTQVFSIYESIEQAQAAIAQ
jgi:anti-anti-sigma factor